MSPALVRQPRPPNETDRLAALCSYDILDTQPEESFDRLTRLATRLFGVPYASVSLVDSERVWFKSRVGFDAVEIDRETSFCSHAVLSPAVFVVPDALDHEAFRKFPVVTGPPYIRFYAGAPLLTADGLALGTLCLLDCEPRELSEGDASLLAGLAALVVDQFESRRTSKQLLTSSSDYQNLCLNAPVGIYRTSPAGEVLMANPAIMLMLGYDSLEELQSRNLEQEHLVETRAEWRRKLEAAGKIAGHETIWYGRDGRPVAVRESTRVVRSQDGRIRFYEGWAEDISQRRAAEHLVQKIVSNIPDFLYIYDLEEQRATYKNGGLTAILGYESGDMGLFPVIASEQERYRTAKDGEVLETETRMQHANGEWRWLRIRHRVFSRNESSAVREILGVVSDVTERVRMRDRLRHQEERWQLALAANNDGLWDWDASTNAVFHSARWKEMLDYEASDQLDWESLLHPDDAPRVTNSLNRYLTRETPAYEVEYRVRSKDGTYRWVLARGIAQWDETGKPLRMVGSHSDITERKQAELVLLLQNEALEEAKERAEAAAVAKSSFLATMSHEIRTPLNGIIGMTSVLSHTELTAEQEDHLATIRNSGEALLAIINDILDFSRIESGKLDIERADFDLWNVIEESVGMVAESAHRKGLEVAAPIDPSVGISVRGDAGRLRQVLLNLLGNAVKFTHKGEIVLRVSPVVSDRSSLILRFEISDTGIGIVESMRARIFDAFTQADASTTRRFGGSGLGLAICKQLVGLMGGEIGVESQVGQGSTFWFTVRFDRAIVGKQPEAPNSELRGRRILVVDDHPTNRKVVQLLLERFGVIIHCAGDGEQALKLLEEMPFDLALLDFQMPAMNGLMLARAIRARAGLRNLPLVLLTSLTEREQAEEAADLHIHSTLLKPIRHAQLLATIREAVQGSPAAPAAAKPSAQNSAQARGRILLAEDNPVNQKVCGLILKRLGYTVDIVGNGRDALEAVQNAHYQAILLDCQMPEMDGLEAARLIRERETLGARIPIIALTANAMSGEREKCLDAGMDDYLAKPVRPELLGAKLDEWIF